MKLAHFFLLDHMFSEAETVHEVEFLADKQVVHLRPKGMTRPLPVDELGDKRTAVVTNLLTKYTFNNN